MSIADLLKLKNDSVVVDKLKANGQRDFGQSQHKASKNSKVKNSSMKKRRRPAMMENIDSVQKGESSSYLIDEQQGSNFNRSKANVNISEGNYALNDSNLMHQNFSIDLSVHDGIFMQKGLTKNTSIAPNLEELKSNQGQVLSSTQDDLESGGNNKQEEIVPSAPSNFQDRYILAIAKNADGTESPIHVADLESMLRQPSAY